MLKIDYESSKEIWNKFLLRNNGSFLQSFEWGEFQKTLNKKIWRFKIKKIDNDDVVAETQIIKETFPLFGKSLFYIPFGPVFKKGISDKEKEEILNLLLRKLKTIADKEKAIFLKIEPTSKIFLPNSFFSVNSLKRIQPQKTLVLDLKKQKEEIFKGFSYRVRYNIRLSERKGVKIEFKDKYLPEFYRLMTKTAKTNRFRSFEEEHYEKLFDFSDEDFKVKLTLANYKGKIVATNILILFGDRVICLHGASDRDFRALKAPTFLQWEQIKFAKDNGYKIYDFWGIDEKKWPGITFFKKSFGGKKIEYPGGVDVIFQSFWYKFYKILKKLKRCL